MKVLFLVIGKTVDKHLTALINDYANRVKHYIPFDMEVIPELKNTKALTPEQQKERESDLLQKQLREGDYVVLLDEGGKEFRSVEFAAYIRKEAEPSSPSSCICSWRPLWFLANHLQVGTRKGVTLQNDLLTPNGSLVLCRTNLPRHDHIAR